MSRTPPNAAVEHLKDQGRFRVAEGDKEAYLDYRLSGDSIDFYSTYVPFAWRGTGVGEILVKQGLDWAQGEQLTIAASCWYADKIFREQTQ